MAFSTVTGSDGITSLVGTTGTDVAVIVDLSDDVFIGGNTGDDVVDIDLFGESRVAKDYAVRMGGGNDELESFDPILDSFISLDGEVLANDGNDRFDANEVINSEVVGRGGNDVIDIDFLSSSLVNGNTGNDIIEIDFAAGSAIFGGQGVDTIQIFNNSNDVEINGNRGSDSIFVGAVDFGSSEIFGGQGDDSIEVFSGDDQFVSGDLGADFILTNGGDDAVEGGDGNDELITRGGNDTLEGGAGNDILEGGADADVMSGGSGDDLFEILFGDSVVAAGKSSGYDRITDFNVSDDEIFTSTLVTTIFDRGTVSSLGGSLSADLSAFVGFPGFTNAATITITGAVDWAGSYVIVDDNFSTLYDANDTVFQINTVAGLTTANFI